MAPDRRGPAGCPADHLADSPSLHTRVEEAMRSADRPAHIAAERETGLAGETFRKACPLAFDDAVRDDFRPD